MPKCLAPCSFLNEFVDGNPIMFPWGASSPLSSNGCALRRLVCNTFGSRSSRNQPWLGNPRNDGLNQTSIVISIARGSAIKCTCGNFRFVKSGYPQSSSIDRLRFSLSEKPTSYWGTPIDAKLQGWKSLGRLGGACSTQQCSNEGDNGTELLVSGSAS